MHIRQTEQVKQPLKDLQNRIHAKNRHKQSLKGSDDDGV
jgi:hypothetical protein